MPDCQTLAASGLKANGVLNTMQRILITPDSPANFDLMLKIILISGVIFLILTIVLYALSKKLEPSKAEIKESFRISCEAIAARHTLDIVKPESVPAEVEVKPSE